MAAVKAEEEILTTIVKPEEDNEGDMPPLRPTTESGGILKRSLSPQLEAEDVKIGTHAQRSLKRRRLKLYVQLESMADILKREKDVKTQMKGKAKTKKKGSLRALPQDIVSRRLKEKKPLETGLDPFIRDWTFRRDWFSSEYGGNCQSTDPTFKDSTRKRLGLEKRDGKYVEHITFPSNDFSPHVPGFAGKNGLFFGLDYFANGFSEDRSSWGIFCVIARQEAGAWQYMGQYKYRSSESLTKEEWSCLMPRSKSAWVNWIMDSGGVMPRAVAALWDEYGHKPSVDEVDDCIEAGLEFEHIGPDDIRRSFDLGQQKIAVWFMECVGYKKDFQLKLIDDLKDFESGVKKPRKQNKKPKKPKREPNTSDED